jgi:hypothetical protein
MSRHANAVPGSVTPRTPHAPTRWRLAKPGSRLKGCPLRSDQDQHGVAYLVCCSDIQGTLSSCHVCQRHGALGLKKVVAK